MSACNVGDPGSVPGVGDLLEEEMTTHSSTLVCKISWAEEPGRLQSMGSQRVEHNLSDFIFFPFQRCYFCSRTSSRGSGLHSRDWHALSANPWYEGIFISLLTIKKRRLPLLFKLPAEDCGCITHFFKQQQNQQVDERRGLC